MNRQQASSWFTFPRPRPAARLRLFCFPYAGGSAAIYRQWAARLPPSVEVCLARLPGRETRLREPPFTDLMRMVSAVAPAVAPHLDMPFAFFGHSMGAMISFELARLLRRERRQLPAALFVSGRPAPQLPVTEKRSYDLPDAEFKEKLLSLNGTPREVLEHPELMELMMPLLRADFSVVETYEYVPEPPLECPVIAFGGTEDASISREQVEGWRAQTGSLFRLWMIPGDHFFLNSAADLLLERLSRELLYLEAALPRP
jgi:medium-chain acyl-[acyl-carrier-protein] hydrolase